MAQERKLPSNSDFKPPPGTIYVNDSLYIDFKPVDHLMYSEFLSSIKDFWSEDLHDSIDDFPRFDLEDYSELSQSISPKNASALLNTARLDVNYKIDKKTWLGDIFNNAYYYYNPIVSISKNQAALFCKWRSDLVLLNYASSSKTKAERANFPFKVKYRLPTNTEMRKIYRSFSNSKNLYVINKEPPIKFESQSDENYPPGNLIFYRIKEITLENKSFTPYNFSKDQDSLHTGFRCICEILSDN